MKVPLYNQEAEVVGELDLNSKIYEVKPSMHLMAESVRVQQSSARVGLAHTKTRGEVSGEELVVDGNMSVSIAVTDGTMTIEIDQAEGEDHR
jgi:hypothetical protein